MVSTERSFAAIFSVQVVGGSLGDVTILTSGCNVKNQNLGDAGSSMRMPFFFARAFHKYSREFILSHCVPRAFIFVPSGAMDGRLENPARAGRQQRYPALPCRGSLTELFSPRTIFSPHGKSRAVSAFPRAASWRSFAVHASPRLFDLRTPGLSRGRFAHARGVVREAGAV